MLVVRFKSMTKAHLIPLIEKKEVLINNLQFSIISYKTQAENANLKLFFKCISFYSIGGMMGVMM